MSATTTKTIDDLPNEIMYKLIIDNQDHARLKILCTVSRRWNNIISNSTEFLINTKLTIDLEKEKDYLSRDGSQIRREYDSLSLNGWMSNFERVSLDRTLLNNLSNTMSGLKEISLSHISISKRRLKTMLQLTLNLGKLELAGLVEISKIGHKAKRMKSEPEALKYLRKLTVNSCDWVLELIKCPKLKYFHLVDTDYRKSTSLLNNFFNELKSDLECLSLTRVNFKTDIKSLAPSFKWKRLNLSGPIVFGGITNLAAYGKLAHLAHEDAQLMFDYGRGSIDNKVFVKVLSESKNVTKVYISNFDPQELNPANSVAISRMGTMNKVKSLVFQPGKHSNTFDRQRLRVRLAELFEKFKNIENLEIRNCECFSPHDAASAFSKVQNLKLHVSRSMSLLQLPSLESLEVEEFAYSQSKNLKSFAIRHGKLTKVKVTLMKGFNDFGDDVFLLIYKIVPSAEVVEIYDNETSTLHSMTQVEIETKHFGGKVSISQRIQRSTEWKNSKLRQLDRLSILINVEDSDTEQNPFSSSSSSNGSSDVDFFSDSSESDHLELGFSDSDSSDDDLFLRRRMRF